jgi:hypothetical protein
MQSVSGGINVALKNARLEPMINDRGRPTVLVFPEMAQGAWADEDFGSAGPACIFAIGVCIAGGKDGLAYPIRTANLGGTTVADLAVSARGNQRQRRQNGVRVRGDGLRDPSRRIRLLLRF